MVAVVALIMEHLSVLEAAAAFQEAAVLLAAAAVVVALLALVQLVVVVVAQMEARELRVQSQDRQLTTVAAAEAVALPLGILAVMAGVAGLEMVVGLRLQPPPHAMVVAEAVDARVPAAAQMASRAF